MTNGTEKYIGTVAYLGKLYDFCNSRLFNGEFTKPVITVQRDERNKTNGWWSVSKVWKSKEDENRLAELCKVCEEYGHCNKGANCAEHKEADGEHELNMTAQQLSRPVTEIAATMIHEMCHQYATVNNMQDTSRSGTYHNKLFKKIAETHGLNVECVATIGWSHTTLTDETAALIAEFAKDNPPEIIYRAPVVKGQCVKTSSTRKYICPCCGNSVRATKQVNIMCADCNELMTCED